MIIQLRAVFCPSFQYLSFFCEAFSWTILDSSSFPLFHSGQVFHELICPLNVVLPQIFFSLTTLFSYPVFFCLFHAPLMLLFTSLYFSDPSGSNRFFLSSLLLLHWSRISLVTQNFFLLAMFAKDLTGCFNHCCVEGGDHRIHVCVFIIRDGDRCKLPPIIVS